VYVIGQPEKLRQRYML